MSYRLNRKSSERLKSLIRSGKYVDRPWAFSAQDGNRILGDPPDWLEYEAWHLGVKDGFSTNGRVPPEPAPVKDDFAYPFGKNGVAYLSALRAIASQASAQGANDIADVASECLAKATELDDDKKVAGEACDRDVIFASGRVDIRAAVGDGKRLPTVDANVYNGGALELKEFKHPVVIDLAGFEYKGDEPILLDHDPKTPLGHTTAWRIGQSTIDATGIVSAAGKHVDDTVESSKRGFPYQVSVGAKILQAEFIPKGDTGYANGKSFAGPVIIARRSSAREWSLLSMGADTDTSARIAARAAAKGSPMKLKKKFAAWAKARNIKMADMEDDGMASAAKAMYKAQMKCEADDENDEDDDGKDEAGEKDKKDKADAAARKPDITASGALSPADVAKQTRQAMIDERKRFGEVSAKLDEYKPHVAADKFADIEARALSGEYDMPTTELKLIQARRPTFNAPMVNTGKGADLSGAIIAAAACRSAGLAEKSAMHGLDERMGNIVNSGKMQGMTLHKIIAAAAATQGIHVQAGGIDDSFLADFIPRDKAFNRQMIRAADGGGGSVSGGGFSTMSLTGITENILYKFLMDAYSMQESVVGEIAYETDTNDFKPYKRYRLTGSGQFALVGTAGELKAFSLQDESYQNQLSTYGVLLTLTRQIIINDDMGALTQSPQAVGEEAAQNRESLVITTLLTGTATAATGPSVGKPALGFNFFSTGAKNYLSGASSALSISSLTTAVQKFREMKNANGRPIGIPPRKILVAPANEAAADNLFQGANLTVTALTTPAVTTGPVQAANTASQTVNLNQHKGKYRPIVSPYLSASYLGNDTQFLLATDPASGKAVIQVGYLRGQRTPIIRQVETDAAVLGIAYQAVQDIGVALHDWRCGVYSAGQ